MVGIHNSFSEITISITVDPMYNLEKLTLKNYHQAGSIEMLAIALGLTLFFCCFFGYCFVLGVGGGGGCFCLPET